MASKTSRPGFMIVGGIIFLLLPGLLARADNRPLNARLLGLGVAVAALFFYLAFKYHRNSAKSVPPA
jgi:hypothetical protein